jgi:hypothetical protein
MKGPSHLRELIPVAGLSQACRHRYPRGYTSTCCPCNRQQPRQASLLNQPPFLPDYGTA